MSLCRILQALPQQVHERAGRRTTAVGLAGWTLAPHGDEDSVLLVADDRQREHSGTDGPLEPPRESIGRVARSKRSVP